MKKPGNPGHKSVTIHLDPELALQLEQMMISLGLDSKSHTALALIHAGLSACAQDAFLASTLQYELKRFRDHESDALAKFYEDRGKLFRSGR